MHRYPTRYQLKLKEQQNKDEIVYIVNLKQRSYFVCTRSKAPQLVQDLKTPLTKSDSLIGISIGTSRWDKNDKVVFCPDNCKGYVFKNFNHIY